MKKEDRYRYRLPIEEEVRLQFEDVRQFRVEYAENISEGGIFIKTSQPLTPCTQFRLSMRIGGEEISAVAQVIWTKEFPKETGRASGMGARFVDLTESHRKRIEALIEQALPSPS